MHDVPAALRPGQTFASMVIEAVLDHTEAELCLRGRDLVDSRPMRLRVVSVPDLDPKNAAQLAPLQRAMVAMRSPKVEVPRRVGLVPGGLGVYFLSDAPPDDTLAARVSGPVPWQIARRWLVKLLDALGGLHADGYAHGALSPASVGFREGRLVLLDPGVERWISEARTKAQQHDGLLLPEPETLWHAFTAPEWVTGQPLDARTDLYAVAHLAFLMATGAPYREAPNGSTMIRFAMDVMNPDAPSATARVAERGTRHELPANFDAWFSRATMRRPEERYLDAATMRKHLP